MKPLKIKLSYHEVQAIDIWLGEIAHPNSLDGKNYAIRSCKALLFEFGLKKIKPHTYLSFPKTKTFSLSIAIACALIYVYNNTAFTNAFTENALRKVVFELEPKIHPSL